MLYNDKKGTLTTLCLSFVFCVVFIKKKKNLFQKKKKKTSRDKCVEYLENIYIETKK